MGLASSLCRFQLAILISRPPRWCAAQCCRAPVGAARNRLARMNRPGTKEVPAVAGTAGHAGHCTAPLHHTGLTRGHGPGYYYCSTAPQYDRKRRNCFGLQALNSQGNTLPLFVCLMFTVLNSSGAGGQHPVLE